MTVCGSSKEKRHFGGIYRLRFQVETLVTEESLVTLNMEAICSSETRFFLLETRGIVSQKTTSYNGTAVKSITEDSDPLSYKTNLTFQNN
jgi:hypothetical protein